MTCLFVLEKNIAKGKWAWGVGVMISMQRWYRWFIPTAEYQQQIRTLSSFFLRLFGVDEAIRYNLVQGDGGAEETPREEEERSVTTQVKKSTAKKRKRPAKRVVKEENSDSSLFESET